MIKFFRKIRQKMLTENKFSKYLLYALGEILLVMIGILLALQVNNWNETKKNQQLEIKYLNNIKREVENNQRQMKGYVINRFSLKMEGLQKAKSYANGNYKIKDTLAFLSDVSYGAVFSNGIDILNSSIFEELKSTGNIQLISNDSLKIKILNYYHGSDDAVYTARQYVSGYLSFINSLRNFNRENPDFISFSDQLFMLKKMRSEETIIKANLEMTYASTVNRLISDNFRRAKDLVDDINQELKNLAR